MALARLGASRLAVLLPILVAAACSPVLAIEIVSQRYVVAGKALQRKTHARIARSVRGQQAMQRLLSVCFPIHRATSQGVN
jgi:hypothetical protein